MSNPARSTSLISPRAKDAKIPLRSDGTKRRVLYAEDQATSRHVTKVMLERMGFIVDAVEDGDHAVQAARNDNYDVILLDIEMPVMDGVTAARFIRAACEPPSSTPILALSAFLADSTENCSWRDAFDSALPKPANGNELFNAMKSAVESKDALTARSFPGPEAIVSALKEAMPQDMWKELSAETYNKMLHLANVQSAAREAGDDALCTEVTVRLENLTLQFGAMMAAELASNDKEQALRHAVSSWVVH